MFRIHFGTVGHNLTGEDFEWLAHKTEGFAGSDIETFVRHLMHYPIRLLQRCHYFRLNEEEMWEMSNPEEGEEKDVMELPQGKVVIPIVDFVEVLFVK